MNLQKLIQESNLNLDLIISIEGHPVWDYKQGKEPFDICLISEDPWEGVESEYVTLRELISYSQELNISEEDVCFYTESDYEQLISVNVTNNQIVLSHY